MFITKILLQRILPELQYALFVTINHMSCEPKELFYHLLLKVKAISVLQELLLSHRILRYLVIHQ